ncbi:Polysaccharide biosynthesis export protein [Croceitalea dokdonensis DOKDO 023]|uniref:Polysaccharide biosynthesis export protein n=1 Tax=Croceitalea dokdonensis DOKDO 023 TaxID=1300341 RepID=A0A0P7ACL5_9FLAO|nr:flippase [Croceitalea dokdonensis]KPM30953.1 Polysaccharide biosynthesis export protein [Croceitalea dokdonensis DOKDO 023]
MVKPRAEQGKKLVSGVLGNLLWLFFDKAYGALISLFIYGLLARHLEQELFGVWNYILAFGTIIPAIAGLGLNFILVKKIKETPGLTSLIIGNALVLRASLGLIVGVLFFVFYLVIGINAEPKYLMVVVLIFVSQVLLNSNVFIYKNEADLNNRQTVISRNIALTVGSLLRFLGIQYDFGLEFFAFTAIAEYGLFLFVSWLQFNTLKEEPLEIYLNKRISSYLFKQGLPLMLSAVTVILYLKIDQLIIGFLLDNKSVGVYAAASRISEMFYAVPVIISSVYYPKIVELKRNFIKQRNLLRYFYFIILVITGMVTIFISFFSDEIIIVLFGKGYLLSSQVLKIYAWSILFMALLVSSSKFLLSLNRGDIIFKRSLIGLVSNVVLNFILIPNYGILGAAWATLISYGLAAYFANFFFSVLRPVMIDQLLSPFYFLKTSFAKGRSER